MARHLAPALLIAGLAGCDSTGPRAPPPCLAPVIEFQPTDCAVLAGRLLGPAGPLAAHGVIVDSVVPLIGFAYSSSSATTSADGRVVLTVYRVARFTPPTQPDTATVEVKVFIIPSRAVAAGEPDARGFVRLLFAPAGAIADTTRADIVVGIGVSGRRSPTRRCC